MNYGEQAPKRAVIYVRISDDREGAGLGVARQEADARALAERLGWEIGHPPVVENDTSAFKRRTVRRPNGRTELRVVRPGFRSVIDLIESGAADGLIAYDLDRTARDPRDLEDLIDAVEQRVPRVPVTSVSGSLRLDNDADITMARVMVAVANKSSRDTARRVARKHQELAQSGRYAGGGARRFGYEADGVTICEPEASIVREAAERILRGESARAICRDLDQRGVKPVKAERWSTNTLIGILKSGRIAGLREHRGEVVTTAAWPAIIDPDLRDELLAQLAMNSNGAGKAALRYWCNHLLWCSKCGGPLTGATANRGSYRYWCSTNRTPRGCGRIAISGKSVEGEVERMMLEYLGRADVVAAIAAGGNKVATDETRRLLAEDEKALHELALAHGERQITMTEWLTARGPIDARVRVYQQALQAVLPRQVRDVLTAPDIGAAWQRMDAHDRRDLVAVVLGSRGYKGWSVSPHDLNGPRTFDPTRLSLARS